LYDKIRNGQTPLVEHAGTKPYRGVLTGFNKAFLIDTATKDRLVSEDSRAATIIKPYLRGQDVGRWSPKWRDHWMIFARRGIDIDTYPSVARHLRTFKDSLEPRPKNWKPAVPGQKWHGRKEGSYAWYELQDSIDYWHEFEKPKIIYQEIQYHSAFAFDDEGLFSNNKTFILTADLPSLLAILNAPMMWWFTWRFLPHMKDEALSPMGFRMEQLPIALFEEPAKEMATAAVCQLIKLTKERRLASLQIHDWLKFEFELTKPSRALLAPDALDGEAFVTAVREALPKKRKLSAAEISELRREHTETIGPSRLARAEIFALENQLSELVNKAYGLTPEEVALMWRTAPPRMPFTPAGLAYDVEEADTINDGEDAD
jgi:hypothetical protein